MRVSNSYLPGWPSLQARYSSRAISRNRNARQRDRVRFRKMVLPDRIELSTSPLPRECSTTELRQRGKAAIAAILATGPKRRQAANDRHGRPQRQPAEEKPRPALAGSAARKSQAPQGAGESPRGGGGTAPRVPRFRRNFRP